MEPAAGITISIIVPALGWGGTARRQREQLAAGLLRHPNAEIVEATAASGAARRLSPCARARTRLARRERPSRREAFLGAARAASGRSVLFIDTISPAAVAAALQILVVYETTAASLLIGSRRAPRPTRLAGAPTAWLLWVAAAAVQWCVPGARASSDPLSGVFLADRTLVECLPASHTGWMPLLEILAMRPACSIAEVPCALMPPTRSGLTQGARALPGNLLLLARLAPGIGYALRSLAVCAAFWLAFLAVGALTGGHAGRGHPSLIAPERTADSGIYIALSRALYGGEGNVPFLPFYPVLIAAMARLTHSRPAAALLISFIGAATGVWVVQAFADELLGAAGSRRALSCEKIEVQGDVRHHGRPPASTARREPVPGS